MCVARQPSCCAGLGPDALLTTAALDQVGGSVTDCGMLVRSEWDSEWGSQTALENLSIVSARRPGCCAGLKQPSCVHQGSST
jgi:hypothetical protein